MLCKFGWDHTGPSENGQQFPIYKTMSKSLQLFQTHYLAQKCIWCSWNLMGQRRWVMESFQFKGEYGRNHMVPFSTLEICPCLSQQQLCDLPHVLRVCAVGRLCKPPCTVTASDVVCAGLQRLCRVVLGGNWASPWGPGESLSVFRCSSPCIMQPCVYRNQLGESGWLNSPGPSLLKYQKATSLHAPGSQQSSPVPCIEKWMVCVISGIAHTEGYATFWIIIKKIWHLMSANSMPHILSGAYVHYLIYSHYQPLR